MTSGEKTEECPFADIFDEDEAERAYLLSKPTCFIVFGKPGSGKTTLARHIAQAWKCIHVEALSVLEEHIANETESGIMLQSLLNSGHSVPDEFVTKLLLEKLSSSEVSHFGYILTELPSLTSSTLTAMQQIELIKHLKLKPDIIINLKCADYDLYQRMSGQRQHSTTGYIYTREQWDPEIIEGRRRKKKDIAKEGKVEEEEEEEEQEEEEAFIAEMQMVAEIFQYLVQRPEDFIENVESTIQLYKENILQTLEEVMAEHNPQYLIELDANKAPEELFLMVIDRMKHLNLKRAAILTKLQSTEEEISDIADTEDLFRTVSSYKLIAPRYRWQRSRWGHLCPVSLKEGTILPGLADFSVSFLGKMYCLSSEEALKTFLLNPRPYLLPPMPIPPCKVVIFGPTCSGKTTLSDLIAKYFKGKVIDYAKIIQPRFDEARETLIKNTIAEATDIAIKTIRDRLHAESLIRKQREEQSLMEFQRQTRKKELEELSDSMFVNPDELPTLDEEAGYAHDSERDTSLVVSEEDKSKSERMLDVDDEKEISDLFPRKRSSQDLSQETVVESDKVSAEDPLEEVTANHPLVVSMLRETLKHTKDLNFDHPYDKHAEILEEVLKEVMEENKNRFTGAPKYGGWVVDNCPFIKELWMAFIDRGITIDLVIHLSDMENNGKCLLNRMYLKNKSVIDAKILERLLADLQKKKKEEASEQKAKEEQKTQEEKQKLLPTIDENVKEIEDAENEAEEDLEHDDYEDQEESQLLAATKENRESLSPDEFKAPDVPEAEAEPGPVSQPPEATTVHTEVSRGPKEGLESKELSEAVVLPEFPEDGYPNVPEMDPFKENINSFLLAWKPLEQLINEFFQIFTVEISNKTPNELLQKIVEAMEKPFQYNAWELNTKDYDEETDDYQAEMEVDEEQGEEEEEEDEGEERIKEKRRHLGDTKHFCPVALKENFVLQPGTMDEVAKYREKIYYFSSSEAKDKFLEHPEDYVTHGEPLKTPPVRICLLGPHGAGKTLYARYLAEKFGIFHIQFDEFLQEKLLLKAERRFGPEYEEDSEEEQATKKEMEELAAQVNIKLEDENKKQLPEVQLTEEEEAIKSSIMENEPLPSEILDSILSEWWLKEPIRSTGFILDGFPRYPEEAQFLGKRGFFPDTAVIIRIDEQDIFDRLLPAQVEKWKVKQNKKFERKTLIRDMRTKIREDAIAKRRAELISERERKKEETNEDDDISEEEPEEEEDIENILEEEFPKEEDEMKDEDEEQESNATDRLRSELGEKFEADVNNIQMIQAEFERVLIPIITVNGARKIRIVQYVLNTKLKPLVENRASILEKCYSIPANLAHKMLAYTYKYMSSFGFWDPVKLSEGEIIKPLDNTESPIYPVIHRQYIYFLSSKETRDKFMMNPIKYIRQPKPKLAIPIRIFILGPPKSGKTTVAKKLESEYGLKRLSIGDCLRAVLNNHPETELALKLNWHLHKGKTVPDELALQALDLSLMDTMCNTIGTVIDGYPVTTHQMNLLEARSIVPMIIFELEVTSKEIFKRLLLDKKRQQSFPYPLHNSSQIMAVKNAVYRRNVKQIREYYQKQHQNWHVIDGFHSKWWVLREVNKNIQKMNKYMDVYMERIQKGKAACIDKLCITPDELTSRLGEFGQFCPVSLAESYELLDCSLTDSLEFAAEFRGHYYKMNSREKLNKFLEHPELYVPPLAPYPLPTADMIPKRLSLSELKSRFPKCAELQGYCPVTFQDGKQKYEALVPGNIKYAAEYRERIYIFETEEKLQKFLRLPLKYWDQQLPQKLPPLKEPIHLTSLPLPGYLEQGIATSLIKAMNSAGCLRPKFPFLSVRRSALLYIAFHLKAFNPKGSAYSRQKYKKKMDQFIERCELITYLSGKMTRKYKEPQFRAIDFDHKLQIFLSLRNIDPVNG